MSCGCGSVLYSISHLVESVLHDPDLLLDNDVLLLAHVHTGEGTEEEERERSEEVERGRSEEVERERSEEVERKRSEKEGRQGGKEDRFIKKRHREGSG